MMASLAVGYASGRSSMCDWRGRGERGNHVAVGSLDHEERSN